ncbi:penicillin G acylase [Alcaligenes sp. RM2]
MQKGLVRTGVAAAGLILGLAGAPAHAQVQSVEVMRDSYGVPHVFADSHYGLYYGYGYAVAQDRLFQMDMARRSFVGTTAAVLGPGEQDVYVKYDMQVRQNFTPASIQRQIAALSKDERDIFRGYADGYNAYLEQVRRRPELLPKEYIDFDFQPEPLTDFDVVMIWVGSMANRFSDTNLEVTALAMRQSLEKQHGPERGRALFDELLWINDTTAPTTVPAPAAQRKPQARAGAQNLTHVSSQVLTAELERQDKHWGGRGPDFAPKASNLWSTRPERVQDGSTILINGPQFGWYNPAYTYGIGLHGAGFDVVGNTPFAYPIVLFGTNSEIAWGATAGPQDVVDMYQEKLNPARVDQYWFNNAWRTMEQRKERIQVRGQADREMTIWRTVHGPVMQFDYEQGTAYSKKRSWDGYEVQSLLAWLNVAKARNWMEFLDQASKMAISINWYYADKHGNIGYVSPAFLPQRPANQDIRVPAKGDGSMEWQGIKSFDAIPKAYNPPQGYLVNWNNKPASDKTNTDTYYWTYGDRMNELASQYQQKDVFSVQEIWAFNKKASYSDVNWRYFRPHLEKLAQSLPANDAGQAALTTLLAWDGMEHDQAGQNAGPARVLFKTWLEEMYKQVLMPVVPESHRAMYSQTGFATQQGPNPGSINLSMGTKVLLRALALEAHPDPKRVNVFGERSSQEIMHTALQNAQARLSQEQGAQMERWTMPTSVHRFSDKNFTGTPQTNSGNTFAFTGYQNRGTENNRVVFDTQGVKFCDAMPPGQSGFTDRNGVRSPHYEDQLKLYENFECKTMDVTHTDIRRNAQSSTMLLIQPQP